MRGLLFKICLVWSFVLLATSLSLWVVARDVDPSDQYISFSDDLHASLLTGRVALFNDADYGPYTGSIISISEADAPEAIGFGRTCGIYYRHFRWSNGDVLWTFAISLLYPIVVSSILPVCWLLGTALRRTRSGLAS